jgi:hypothetical protein
MDLRNGLIKDIRVKFPKNPNNQLNHQIIIYLNKSLTYIISNLKAHNKGEHNLCPQLFRNRMLERSISPRAYLREICPNDCVSLFRLSMIFKLIVDWLIAHLNTIFI